MPAPGSNSSKITVNKRIKDIHDCLIIVSVELPRGILGHLIFLQFMYNTQN